MQTLSRQPGKIITFYSFKGGTGRSMALANVAWILASAGKRVIALDWDLEAPGLYRYFLPFLLDPDLANSDGIIDFVSSYSADAMKMVEPVVEQAPLPPGRSFSELNSDEQMTIANKVLRQPIERKSVPDLPKDELFSEDWFATHADLLYYKTSINWRFFGGGLLDFVPAGRQSASYPTRVNSFDWGRFYTLYRGGRLLDRVAAQLRETYEYILIDSRTGVSDTSGICTMQLPDILAACFTMNNQGIQGLHGALSSIRRQREDAARPIDIYPLPMRIELGEADRLEIRRRYARQMLEPFLSSTNVSDQKLFWDGTEVLGVPIYSYEETLAPFRDSGGVGSVLETYRRITHYLTGIEVDPKVLQPTDDQRSRVLASFAGIVSGKEASLATKAEQLFLAFSPEDQDAFRNIVLQLIKLVAPGQDQLQTIDEPDLKAKVHVVLAARDAGILNVLTPSLTQNYFTSFELADRNLLWSWPRLVDWMSRERAPQSSAAPVPTTPIRLDGSSLPHPEWWGPLADRYARERPRKMLALDGGGVRSLVTLQILHAIERQLSETLRADVSFRLCHYFDYIAGTSTGAILAAGLALGMSVSELKRVYLDMLPAMFEPSSLINRVKYFYAADPLKTKLQAVFGADTTLRVTDDLDKRKLGCLLLIVTKNVTTDSPWVITSNPEAKYNDPDRQDCNLRIPLWQLVRASTAAPVYYPPETIQWDPSNPSKSSVFVDGGMTPYNNPAFLLYRMATEPAYRLNWATGESKLLIVSVGTGAAESLGATAGAPNKNIVSTMAGIPGELMYGTLMDQDINCRTVGRCTYGAHLDREILDLVPRQVDVRMSIEEQYLAPPVPLSTDLGRRFLYARYSADLSRKGLDALGLPAIDADKIQKLDALENVPALLEIGQAAGRVVNKAHFGAFVEVPKPRNTIR